jgi:S1-C subfamily serine protease
MSGYPPRSARRESPLPLVLAGIALVLTAYLVWDRFGPSRGPSVQPRAITPRGELADFERATIAIYEQNKPSVVHITRKTLVLTRYWTYARVPEGAGSGFLWDESGIVVTNFHVIQDAAQGDLFVGLDSRKTYPAKVVATAPEYDVAVLQIIGAPRGLRPIPLGDSRNLRVGQSVFAIGNPFNLDYTLSTGVISALNRTIKGVRDNDINDVIQVDAAINPGNSGGPLLDSAGLLIGMNTAIYSRSGDSAGIGFAVPVETVNRVVSNLLRHGTPGPSLGIMSRTVTVERANQPPLTGAEVVEVFGETAAAAAGLLPQRFTDGERFYGDVIIELGGKRIAEVADIEAALTDRRAGETVEAKILRHTAGGLVPVTVPIRL